MTTDKAPSVTQADSRAMKWIDRNLMLAKTLMMSSAQAGDGYGNFKAHEAHHALKTTKDALEVNAELRADNERLIEANRLRMEETHKERAEAELWFDKAQEWRAENDRLREALAYIGVWSSCEMSTVKARKALEQKP